MAESRKVINRIAAAAVAAVILFMVPSMFYPKYREYKELQARAEALETEFRHEQEHLKLLKTKQELMRTSKDFVEKVAREELSLVKPGETVIQFIEDEPGARRRP